MTDPRTATDEVSDYDITTAMHHMGGSFVAKLAAAWLVADAQNRARLKAAFPDYWEDYRDVVIMRRRQKASAMTALELAEKIAQAVAMALHPSGSAPYGDAPAQAVLRVMHENNAWFIENQRPDWPAEHEQRLDFDHDPPESV